MGSKETQNLVLPTNDKPVLPPSHSSTHPLPHRPSGPQAFNQVVKIRRDFCRILNVQKTQGHFL